MSEKPTIDDLIVATIIVIVIALMGFIIGEYALVICSFLMLIVIAVSIYIEYIGD